MRPGLLSRRDIDFLLFEWLGVQQLTSRPRFADHSAQTFRDALGLSERIARDEFASHNRDSDVDEPSLDDGTVRIIPAVKKALDTFCDSGLMGAGMDYDVGGLQLPATVYGACFAWFQAANAATAAYPMLTTAGANLLLAHGTPEQIDTYARPMISGRYFGTMCLSEPNAGSSLADVTTKAVPGPDGSYRVFGSKMWISAGEHELSDNIVHMVLAKIPGGPPGVKGLSLLLVPKFIVATGERNDVSLVGLNHKMGYRGAVNTALAFGDGAHLPGGEPGAVGLLVGAPHAGLQCMFHMMNETRIGVGAGAAALGYRGYLQSLDYARTRLQGRPASKKQPGTPQRPIIDHPDVRRMLLAQKAYAEGALALTLCCRRLVDEIATAPDPASADRAASLLSVLTPVAKSWPAAWCLYANSLAIQVHGGYGYSREFDVEQLYRDNRLNSIHEGTHGIQALDLLGRKVRIGGGQALQLLVETMLSTARRAGESGRPALSAQLGRELAAAANRIPEVTDRLWQAGDAELALANASIYLDAVGHVVVAWIWLEQVLAAEGKAEPFYEGKRQAARYFYRYELVKTGPQFQLLESGDRATLDMQGAWF